MKKTSNVILSLLTSLALVTATPTALASFSDVNQNNSNFTAINALEENDIISGYADGTFRPNNTINRVEFLKIVLESSGISLDTAQSTGFTDVDENSWYAPYLQKAKKEGWISGYADNTFKPGNTINQVEALKIMAEVQNWTLTDTPNEAWYQPYVNFAQNKNVLNSSTPLDAGKLLTRSEVANLLYTSIIQGVANFTLTQTPNTEVETLNFKPVTAKTLEDSSFLNILLDNNIPNTFYKNEIYTFNGKVTKSGYKQVLIFLNYQENGSTKYLNFVGDVRGDSSFSVPINFSKTGNYQIGIIPGTTGTSKIYDVSVLPTLPTPSTSSTAKQAQNIKISNEDNKTVVAYTKEPSQVYKINISQNNKTVSYFTRQDATSLTIDFKDFANFSTGTTQLSVETATASATAPLHLSSNWVTSEPQNFTATQHESSFIYTDDINIKTFQDTYSTVQKISITDTFLTPGNIEAAIIKPNGLVEKVDLSSSSQSYKYFGYNILPAKSNFTFQYTPKTTGTYIIEFNKDNGAASFNVPVYVGSGIPLLPDYFEVGEDELTTAAINLSTAQKEMLNYINSARKELGFSQLTLDDELNNLSQLHSEDMVKNNYFSHVNLEGQSPSDRRKELEINTEVSENLGKAPSLKYGHEGLMRSAIHRENILEPGWTKVGLGFAKDKDGYIYITQEFSHDPYSDNDLANFGDELFNKINDKRLSLGLQNIEKNETLAKISQALTNDLANNISITSTTLSNYFKEYNVGNKAALVLNGTSPNNEKIITEATKGIDSNHSQWIETGIDYALDQFGSIIFVILYTN